MYQKIIRLCYRKIIETNAQKSWEQYVFNDTYKEFLMQAQLYNQEGKHTLFSELINEVPGAEKLPFLVSSAAVGYLKQLNGIVPDIKNVLGKFFLPFKNYRFEILESSINNKAAHKIAISFISEPLLWHDTVDGNLLLSVSSNTVDNADGALLTDMVALRPLLSIFSLKTVTA